MYTLNRSHAWPILGPGDVRLLEPALQTLGPAPLMQSAGLAGARLAMAIAPHARRVWIAVGPGNNGGDGLEVALNLHQWGKEVVVSLMAPRGSGPADAQSALKRALQAGVRLLDQVPHIWLQQMTAQDLCIDALLGIGAARPLGKDLQACVQAMQSCAAPVLAIDVPTGLNPQSGQWLGGDTGKAVAVRAAHTLCLISVQAGLLMGHGRDVSGQIWLDELGYQPDQHQAKPLAWLNSPYCKPVRAHASHKGSHGDVAIIGGESMAAHGMGMNGAAILAATAALHAGAGRVILAWLTEPDGVSVPPDVMQRPFKRLALEQLHVVCGCGGGTAIAAVLPEVLQRSAQLVLDADGLNAVAQDRQLQNALRQRAAEDGALRATILTPHPLEAARLLDCNTAQVQNNRIHAAQELADRFLCSVVLKGSGTVIAAPGHTPRINPSGNGLLAIGGTGDVLAGLIAARMAQGLSPFDAACAAVAQHGELAGAWPQGMALTASRLAEKIN